MSSTTGAKTVYIVGGKRKQYDTAADAIRVANAYAARTGIIVSVEARTVRPRAKTTS